MMVVDRNSGKVGGGFATGTSGSVERRCKDRGSGNGSVDGGREKKAEVEWWYVQGQAGGSHSLTRYSQVTFMQTRQRKKV